MKILKKLMLFLLLAPAPALGHDSQTCEPPSRHVVGPDVQIKEVKVRKVQDVALLPIGGKDNRKDFATVMGVCLALYSVPEGHLVAVAHTGQGRRNSGAFESAGLAPGSYRLVSVLSHKAVLAPIDASVEVVRWPRGGVFKRAKVYLHFRPQSWGLPSYASTTRKKYGRYP